jgi:uncharacterized protein YjbI with pentapeptide repeats
VRAASKGSFTSGFHEADLKGATLTGAEMTGAIWNRAVCPSGFVAITDC